MSPFLLLSKNQSVHIHFLYIIKLMVLSRWQTRRNILFPQMKGQNWFSHVVPSSSVQHILLFLCSLLLTPESIYQRAAWQLSRRRLNGLTAVFVWVILKNGLMFLFCDVLHVSLLSYLPPSTSLLKPHTHWNSLSHTHTCVVLLYVSFP